MNNPAVAANHLWRSTGVIILCGCLIALITFGPRSTMGLFTAPISGTTGWGREVFALAIAIQNLLWGLCQPLSGAVADRYGPVRVLVAGGLIYAAGVALMAVSTSPALIYLSSGVLIGIGLSGASFAVVIGAFGKLVPVEKRSLAIGLATASGSLGQFVFAPIGQAFIAAYGWQTAALLLSLSVLLVPLLATALNARPQTETASDWVDLGIRETLHLAFAHRSYQLLVGGFFVCGFHVAFITVHLPPYLTELGIAPSLASWSIALIGLFNVIGAYGSGLLGGRFSKKYLLTVIYGARALVITLFILVPISPLSVVLFAAAIGLLWLSTVPPTSGLVAVMFGTRFLTMLFGIVFLSHQVGAFIGVWLGGYLYDRTGTYDLVWWLGVALGLAAAVIHYPIAETVAPRFSKVAVELNRAAMAGSDAGK